MKRSSLTSISVLLVLAILLCALAFSLDHQIQSPVDLLKSNVLPAFGIFGPVLWCLLVLLYLPARAGWWRTFWGAATFSAVPVAYLLTHFASRASQPSLVALHFVTFFLTALGALAAAVLLALRLSDRLDSGGSPGDEVVGAGC